MNEPQVWTLIGVSATALFGLLAFMSTMFLRVIDARFAAVDSRFDVLDVKLEHLDRDVQAITRQVFPGRD